MERVHDPLVAFQGNLTPLLLGILVSVSAVLSVVGCSSGAPATEPPQAVAPPPEPLTSVPATEPPTIVKPAEGQLSFSATPEMEELEDVNWVSPGKVSVENLYPGATAEYPITVHNGGDETAEFAIVVRQPDQATEDYEPLPEEYLSWVVIEQPDLVLEPKETADVLVTITMPETATYADRRAEFWISVIDQSQGSMVRTELAVRWLITTR